MRPLAWMVSLDLSDAYWHVPVHRCFQRFLAIPFQGHPYVFHRLPFGLNIAPRVFTKLVRQALLPLLEKGITIYYYLDDWVILAESPDKCLADLELVVRHISDLGFKVNFVKSSLTPTQSLPWVGLVWNTQLLTITLSAGNRDRLR